MVQILAFGNVRNEIETGFLPVFALWQVRTDEIAKNTKHKKNTYNMKMTLKTSQAAGELMRDTNANWSRAGAYALAEYLEEYEESTGEELELDVCAIRCDFSEHSSLLDWAHDYFSNALEELGFDETEENDDDEVNDKIRSYIQDHGQLIEFDGGIIIAQF